MILSITSGIISFSVMYPSWANRFCIVFKIVSGTKAITDFNSCTAPTEKSATASAAPAIKPSPKSALPPIRSISTFPRTGSNSLLPVFFKRASSPICGSNLKALSPNKSLILNWTSLSASAISYL